MTLEEDLLQNGVDFTPNMEWFCTFLFTSFFNLNILCELQNQLR